MDYSGTGGVAMSGTATIEWFYYQYRETVYLRRKAIKGILEKVTIKDRFFNDGYWQDGYRRTYPGVERVRAYKDTLNTIYLEEELARYDEAIDLAD